MQTIHFRNPSGRDIDVSERTLAMNIISNNWQGFKLRHTGNIDFSFLKEYADEESNGRTKQRLMQTMRELQAEAAALLETTNPPLENLSKRGRPRKPEVAE